MPSERSVTREAQIMRTSVVSIVANVLLAGFKMLVGMLSNSVAVLLDGVNSLSDAASSVIAIVGMKLAMRPADKRHPYGYGRIEYFAAVLVAGIVVAAGVMSLVESARKVVSPEPSEFTTPLLVVIVAAIVVKLVLGRYVSAVGKRVKSDSLIASGADATFDAVITLSTLVGAVVSMVWGVSIDGILGVAISIVIVKSGLEMLSSPLNAMVGTRIDPDFARDIKAAVTAYDGVEGAYDLLLHNYGPEHYIGSVHIAVPDTMTAGEIDRLTRAIQRDVLARYGVLLTLGIYASNVSDPELARMERAIHAVAEAHPHVLQVHGVFLDVERHWASFDAIVDFDCEDTGALRRDLAAEVRTQYPDWDVHVTLDKDFSD